MCAREKYDSFVLNPTEMFSKFNKVPLIISLLIAIIVSWLGIWLKEGGVMVVFGVQGSIFWLFWLNILNPFSKLAGTSALPWILSIASFWIPIGLIGGKLCKKKPHTLIFFLGVFALTLLLTLFMFRSMLSRDAGSQIWVPMWPA